MRQSKRPVVSVAGPYGHPFHPILVTVPIGAWAASLVFDVASRIVDDSEPFVVGAYWLVGLGVLGALLAATFGFLDLFAIPTGTKAFRIGLWHMTLNLVIVGLFAVSFLVRRGDVDDGEPVPAAVLGLSIVALAALGASGWLGGKLTFRYGVRVAEETTQVEGFT
jgi:uncharacterized membrane protein